MKKLIIHIGILLLIICLLFIISNNIFDTKKEIKQRIKITTITNLYKQTEMDFKGYKINFYINNTYKNKRFRKYHSVYMNGNKKYNVFLYKRFNLLPDTKYKISGTIEKIENGIIFIIPDAINIIIESEIK